MNGIYVLVHFVGLISYSNLDTLFAIGLYILFLFNPLDESSDALQQQRDPKKVPPPYPLLFYYFFKIFGSVFIILIII